MATRASSIGPMAFGTWSRGDREDLNSPRFISAKGRDINVAEGELHFDPETRHLTYVRKDRKTAGADKVISNVLSEVARASEPMSIRDLAAALKGKHSRANVEAALKQATAGGYLSRVKGAKGAHLHSITLGGQASLELFCNPENRTEETK